MREHGTQSALRPQGRTPEGCPATAAATPVRGSDRKAAPHQETADDFVGVLGLIGARHRVVICTKGLKWILPIRRGARCGRARWIGARCCTSRKSLIEACHALCGQLGAGITTVLEALPVRIGDRS